MSQHDFILDNATGAAFRTDLNNALAAGVSLSSGTTAPATTYAYQFWADTTTGILKIRNAANNAWITVGKLSNLWDSPTLVTPALGTPTSGDLRNCSLAVAPAIGSTTPSTGAFTTLTESTGVAWTDYTPTLTADTGTWGTLTVTLARYRQLGKTLFIHFSCSATVASGSPGEFRLTYPGTMAGGTNGLLYISAWISNNGVGEVGLARQLTGSISFQRASGTFSGACAVYGSFVFEIA